MPWQFSFDERRRFGRRGLAKNGVDRRVLDQAAVVEEQRPRRPGGAPGRGRGWSCTILVPAASMAAIMSSTRARRRRVEAGRRLVEEQHLGRQRPGPRQREALLLAARQHAAPAGRPGRQADALAAPPARRSRSARHAARARSAKRCWPATERRSSTGRWNTIACARRAALGRLGAVPRTVADGRRDQAVAAAAAAGSCRRRSGPGSRCARRGSVSARSMPSSRRRAAATNETPRAASAAGAARRLSHGAAQRASGVDCR